MSEAEVQWTAPELVEKLIIESALSSFMSDSKPSLPRKPSDLSEVVEWMEENDETDWYYEAMGELRHGDVETGLDTSGNRHYESKGVASQIDGKWVGWTYWYGGGKHGEPESIEWVKDAYFLNVTEETKVVQTFTKLEG